MDATGLVRESAWPVPQRLKPIPRNHAAGPALSLRALAEAEAALAVGRPDRAWALVRLAWHGERLSGEPGRSAELDSTTTRAWRLASGMAARFEQPGLSAATLRWAPGTPALPARAMHVAVHAVVVDRLGRFGNSILQVVHSLAVAQALGATVLVLPPTWLLPAGRTVVGGIHVVTGDDAGTELVDLVPARWVALHGFFIHRAEFVPLLSPHFAKSDFTALADAMPVHPGAPLPADHLVVHLRADDVFRGDGADPRMGQPPLAFYSQVLAAREWSALTVVAADQGNPVTTPLIERARALGLRTDFVSGRLHEDLAVLLRARSLVVGRGTFGVAVAGLAPHLEDLFVFDSRLQAFGKRPYRTHWVEDRAGEYRRTVLGTNWRNAPQQRQLMLDYPRSALGPVVEVLSG